MAIYHEQRTVQWGNWGITFMLPQLDRTRNYGDIVGTLYFPCGNQGPCDGFLGSPERKRYEDAVKDWIENGNLPTVVQPYIDS